MSEHVVAPCVLDAIMNCTISYDGVFLQPTPNLHGAGGNKAVFEVYESVQSSNVGKAWLQVDVGRHAIVEMGIFARG